MLGNWRPARRALGLAAGLLAFAGLNALQAEAPYRNLRDATLEYTGPAEDFANLTELRLGWFGPSDPADPLTGDLWFAASLALDEANAATDTPRSGTLRVPSDSSPDGGAGFTPASSAPPSPSTSTTRPSTAAELPFRLVPRWAPDPWRAGVSLLTRMVYDEQPLALLGSVDSASTHLAEQVVAKAQLPLLSPCTTDKSLTLAGVAWMFAFAPSDPAIARPLVDAVLAEGSQTATPAVAATQSAIGNLKSKILLLSGTDHESRLTTREVMREFSRRNQLPDTRFEIAPALPVPPEVLAAIDRSPPTTIVLVATPEDSARWLNTLRERHAAHPSTGAAPRFFGSHTMGRTRFLELAGASAEGVHFPLLWDSSTASPAASSFVARFRAARGHAPDYAAVYTYDATRLLTAAIRQAGPNRGRIREALIALSPWSGLAGPVHFDGTGQNTATTIPLGTIRNGAVLPLRPATVPSQPPSSP